MTPPAEPSKPSEPDAEYENTGPASASARAAALGARARVAVEQANLLTAASAEARQDRRWARSEKS